MSLRVMDNIRELVFMRYKVYHVIQIANPKHTFSPLRSLILVRARKSTSTIQSNYDTVKFLRICYQIITLPGPSP